MKELGFDEIFKDFDLKERLKEVNIHTITISDDLKLMLDLLKSYGYDLKTVMYKVYNEVLTRYNNVSSFQCPSCGTLHEVYAKLQTYYHSSTTATGADYYFQTIGEGHKTLCCFECGYNITIQCGKILKIEVIGEEH